MPNVTWKLLIGQPMDSRRVDTIRDPREQGVGARFHVGEGGPMNPGIRMIQLSKEQQSLIDSR